MKLCVYAWVCLHYLYISYTYYMKVIGFLTRLYSRAPPKKKCVLPDSLITLITWRNCHPLAMNFQRLSS